MDRSIVYPGSIPLDTDLLSTNRNAMLALGAFAAAVIGPQTTVDGLGVAPAGGLAVSVGAGCISTFSAVDQNAYGSLPADVGDAIVKIGFNLAPTTIALSAPTVAGSAITYLIQAAFQESDINPVVLPYYNAANPAQPFLGPANSGAAQPTLRAQRVAVAAKAGVPASAGAAAAPAPDPGWVPLATVNVNAGQSSVGPGDIAAASGTRRIPVKLGDLRPGFSAAQVLTVSGGFVVPPGVSAVRVTLMGGGGAGGTNATRPGGGGGAGGWASGWFYGLVPGSVIPVSVGPGGGASSVPGNGGPGGTSAFGNFIAATGGAGGQGGTQPGPCAGAQGGQGYGGSLQSGGAFGTDSIVVAQRGGTGGGPGGGRGATGNQQGVGAPGYGGGGGGGGSSAPDGSGVGAPGGNGGNGFVLVEY